jgi:hypothetical protein
MALKPYLTLLKLLIAEQKITTTTVQATHSEQQQNAKILKFQTIAGTYF